MENGMNTTAAAVEIEETLEEHTARMKRIADEVKADIKAGRYRSGQVHPHIRGDYARGGTMTGRWPLQSERGLHINPDSYADLHLGKWDDLLMDAIRAYSKPDAQKIVFDSYFKSPRMVIMDESHHRMPESFWINPTKDKDWDQKKFTSGPATTPSEATRIKRREERNRKKRAKK
jgi:hypothetical protein